ncbi:thiamine pyrophosphate-dependent dehydrogenase E1 component subunit alpha [Hydrogenophaga borbori]|jgi:TPP-dependent pyruvate/acetoin dehydrogenase alpha subunit
MNYTLEPLAADAVSEALELLLTMHRIRFLEEKISELRRQGDIQGSVHLCIGQEAIYAGACAALQRGDRVFSTYRGHGWALACGVPSEGILAELLARETGVCRGRGGSAYFSAVDWGFYGENSIVGAGAPIACGAALASLHAGDGAIAVTAFGDGAMNQGAIAEAMNFASYQRLPVMFVCENNTYAELTPIAETVRDPALFRRARAFGMDGVRIDGNNVHEVQTCVAHYAKQLRDGKGPVLIEMMTQRLVGHYYGDMQSYRPAGEVTQAKLHEPIVRLRERLRRSGVSEDTLDAQCAKAALDINEATQRALEAPLASEATVMEHLYA